MIRRVIIAAALVVAVIVVVLLVSGGGGSGNGYLVRAVFDNGAFMVTGEQVRVAGANVGTIESVDVSMPGETVAYKDGKPVSKAGQGDHRDEHRRPRFPGLPQRRQLPDPPAVVDRREVRRLPTHPAARARIAGVATAEEGRRPASPAPASTCCRWAATAPASTRT